MGMLESIQSVRCGRTPWKIDSAKNVGLSINDYRKADCLELELTEALRLGTALERSSCRPPGLHIDRGSSPRQSNRKISGSEFCGDVRTFRDLHTLQDTRYLTRKMRVSRCECHYWLAGHLSTLYPKILRLTFPIVS